MGHPKARKLPITALSFVLGRLPTASSAVQHGSAVQGWLAFHPLRKAALQPLEQLRSAGDSEAIPATPGAS